MNRTFLFSVLGLGVLSAAGIAGSRMQAVSVAAQATMPSATPVVIIKRTDGTTLAAQELHILQEGSDPAVWQDSTGRTQDLDDLQEASEPAELHYLSTLEEGERSDLINRIYVNRSQSRPAIANGDLQRAQEEALAAQARARAAYDEAQRRYQEVLRDGHNRARSEAQAGGSIGARTHWAESERVRDPGQATGTDAELKARVDALERSARERGLAEQSSALPLEDRVARLEAFMQSEKRQPARVRLKTYVDGAEAPTPSLRAGRIPGTNWLVAPIPPVASTPRVAPLPATPPSAASPRTFRWSAPLTGPAQTHTEAAPKVPDVPQRGDLERALTELRAEAARMREELTRMRREIDALPEARSR